MDKPDTDALNALENALRDAEADGKDGTPQAQPPAPDDKIAELEKSLAEAKDKSLRTLAELENFRKRNAKDVQSAYASGMEAAISPVLKLFDIFSLAVKSAEGASDIDSVRKGLKMLMSDFERIVGELGIERIEDATGRDFDPKLHDAVSHAPSDSVPAGKVSMQMNCGYKRGDKLIKAAQVIVSSGPAQGQG